MSTAYIYDQSFNVKSWFDPTLNVSGWFDNGFADYTEEEPPVTPPVTPVVTGGGFSRGRSTSAKKFLEVDGKLIPFNSEAEMLDYLTLIKKQTLSTVKKKAFIAVAKHTNASRPIKTIEAKTYIKLIDFSPSKALKARIEQTNRDIELAYLLGKQLAEELEEEEMFLALL